MKKLQQQKLLQEELGSGGIAYLKTICNEDELDGDVNECEEDWFDEDEETAVDPASIIYAAQLEKAALAPLISKLQRLLMERGDPKVDRAIEQALRSVRAGDRVLVFSRYTDTVDALVEEFSKTPGSDAYAYGIYIGQKSVVVKNGKENEKC